MGFPLETVNVEEIQTFLLQLSFDSKFALTTRNPTPQALNPRDYGAEGYVEDCQDSPRRILNSNPNNPLRIPTLRVIWELRILGNPCRIDQAINLRKICFQVECQAVLRQQIFMGNRKRTWKDRVAEGRQ